ncbi:branched-chain amino acid ABC transporter permease [Desulfovibrio sp. OttesenSCG-928-F20]|nr:branched-chain amino acid ABC transporter permease [Desulfovibrio sp. OttesenSCG-928-F20]
MKGVLRSFLVSLWFMALTFPIMVIRIAPDGSVVWRWHNMLLMGLGIFLLSFVWRALLVVKGISSREEADLDWLFNFFEKARNRDLAFGLGVLALALAPLAFAVTEAVNLSEKDAFPLIPLAVSACIAACGLVFTWACLKGKRRELLGGLSGASARLAEPGLPRLLALAALMALLLPLPWVMDIYRVNVLATTFVWIMLGLGLNIVVGQAGLLVLGYVAFYAVGAYSYAIGNIHFGNELVGFWMLLPIGGLFAAIAGILLSLPVLRLKGDYLAIVTLGFGEIVRVTLEGGSLSLAPLAWVWSLFSSTPAPAWLTTPLNLGGPAGIGGIPYPGFFGMKISMDDSIRLVYYIAMGMAFLTIIAVGRLRDSRVGRTWIALREDEIACEAMGINKVTTKLSAFALGACWAGFGGVLFAAKTTFINPSSFTFMESALILSVVVLGGLGSILGVVLGACILILLPEYLRSFNEYRMLLFGACMVLMMVFRPQGLITPKAKKRVIRGVNDGSDPGSVPGVRGLA